MNKNIVQDTNKIKLIKEVILYGIIGAFSAFMDSLVFIILSKININMYVANFISVNVGIGISFFLNTYINFKMVDNLKQRFIKFFSVGYIGLAISTILLYIGSQLLSLNEIMVKIASIIIVAAIQFILNKLITYK